MKEFFGIDITLDKNSETLNCETFLARQPSPAHTAALDSAAAALDGLNTKAGMPRAFQILYYIVYFFSVAMVIGLIRGIGNVGFATAYHNAPSLFYVAGGFLVLWAVMAVWKNGRKKKVTSTEEFDAAARRAESAAAACAAAMAVPEKAPRVDVLTCKYTVKNGKVKYVTVGVNARYANPEVRIFLENDSLHLADTTHCYAIPLSEIRCLRKINSSVWIAGWNKELGPREGRYKAYKLNTNQYGCVSMKPYYALEILHNGEAYSLPFPCYELPVFQALTKLPITE